MQSSCMVRGELWRCCERVSNFRDSIGSVPPQGGAPSITEISERIDADVLNMFIGDIINVLCS